RRLPRPVTAMKYVVLQGDGMADEPIAELGGKTPLEYARTPNLDHMASRGILGLTRTIPRGLPPGSDVGTMSVLGYDPARYHTGVSYLHRLAWRGGESRMRTTPPHDLSDKPVARHFPDGPGAEVLRDLMERSRRFLAEHPLCQARAARGERVPTSIWLWGQGK